MLSPILTYEVTKKGWCGLTKEGELIVAQGFPKGDLTNKRLHINDPKTGKAIGHYEIPEYRSGILNSYIKHFKRSIKLYKANANAEALEEINLTISAADTTRARFNRALILLALGQWEEGFADYRYTETCSMFMRPLYHKAIKAGIKPWNGENIAGKKLLVMHDHGHGDTIMMLRYMNALKEMGIQVIMQMPKELTRLAAQHGHVTSFISQADYCVSILQLLGILRINHNTIPLNPYLTVYSELAAQWQRRLQNGGCKKIGIAWAVGILLKEDFPRSIPLKLLVKELSKEAELFSVQAQGKEEAEALGVRHFEFEDFADCAAMMSQLDEIVSIDTAAVHLAGAIGHPRITLLLSYWHSWRWLNLWYENLTICRQDQPKDWSSALAKRRPL
jgi:hypothetical protein